MRELAELRRPWWRRLIGLALVAAVLSACSPIARQAAGDTVLELVLDDAATAAGIALRNVLD